MARLFAPLVDRSLGFCSLHVACQKLLPRMSCQQGLVSSPCVQQRRHNRGSTQNMPSCYSDFQVSRRSIRKYRLQQRDSTRNEWSRRACSTKGWCLPVGGKANDAIPRRAQSSPPDGISEVRITKWSSSKVTCNHWNHPGMTRNSGAADRSLIAGGSDDDNAAPCGMIKCLF